MPALSIKRFEDAQAPDEAERVALAYLRVVGDDRWLALVRLAADALVDLRQAEIAIVERERLVSRGYVRAGLGR